MSAKLIDLEGLRTLSSMFESHNTTKIANAIAAALADEKYTAATDEEIQTMLDEVFSPISELPESEDRVTLAEDSAIDSMINNIFG